MLRCSPYTFSGGAVAGKTGFAERLQRIRTEKNLSQSDVARLCGAQ